MLLGVALALLLAHARAYRFLTDDAFISFRYARNLSHGHGLVFNPGEAPVEGYTNFLWVLALAALDRIGLAPERAAPALGFACTVALFGVVVGFALRPRAARGPMWLALLPAFWLAATRSVAVWSSGGLETRAFELLAVAGILALAVEVERRLAGESPVAPIAAWLLALAALTRPDGLLVAAGAVAAAAVTLRARRPAAVAPFARGLVPLAILAGGHELFRRVYYHAWLPNTYYAKVGGHAWWGEGARYLAAFAIEYAAWLWIPLLLAAIAWHRRARTTHVPVLIGAAIVPHALYVAAVGGDHFEYRPLDLYFPLAFLLLADGAAEWARRPRGAALALAYGALVLAGLFELPYRSHREFPGVYLPGFPGAVPQHPAARDFLAPGRDPVYRLPGLAALAGVHRGLIRDLSDHYVGLREEEHRLFLGTVVPDANRLRDLMRRGALPSDVSIAMSAVGVIPYRSGVRTLDRHGLTDANVARGAFVTSRMAHGKEATLEYARERGVDLWSYDAVHPFLAFTSAALWKAARAGAAGTDSAWVADAGAGEALVAVLPRGIEAARRRIPALEFHATTDPAFVQWLAAVALPLYEDSLRAHPDDLEAAERAGAIALATGRFELASRAYAALLGAAPDHPALLERLAMSEQGLGRIEDARAHFGRAIERAAAAGDEAAVARLRARLGALSGRRSVP
jgi:arabinofuranosyltransferase